MSYTENQADFSRKFRLKGTAARRDANADRRIVATHRQWRGRAIELDGKRLKEVAGRLQREALDVEVEVAFQRRRYAGVRRTVRRRLRLVSVR